MPGQLKVGGNVIAEHTGIEGAGEVSLQNVSFPAGHVIQVQSSVLTGTVYTTSNSFEDTGLSVQITPKSTTSKILVSFNTSLSSMGSTYSGQVRIVRDGTAVNVGDAAGSRSPSNGFMWSSDNGQVLQMISQTFLDETAITSLTPITYKLQVQSEASKTLWINRTYQDTDAYYRPRLASNITVQEIAW